MSVQMDEGDSKLVIRLKWLYLFPLFIVIFIPVCLFVGWKEYGARAIHFAWICIRYGTPFSDDGED